MAKILLKSDDNAKIFRERKDRSVNLAKQRATEAQWQMCDWAIKAFISKYPEQWIEFQTMLKVSKSEYGLATKEHKELRSANWRHILSFPVIEDRNGDTIDSLKPVLDKIIPGLAHKNSVNRIEFMKRYKFFCPSEKT